MKTESIQRGKPSPYPDDDISNEPILLNAHEQSYLKAVIRISELEKENAALSAQPKEPIEPVSVYGECLHVFVEQMSGDILIEILGVSFDDGEVCLPATNEKYNGLKISLKSLKELHKEIGKYIENPMWEPDETRS